MPTVIMPSSSVVDEAIKLLAILSSKVSYKDMLDTIKADLANLQAIREECVAVTSKLAAREVDISNREASVAVVQANFAAEQARITNAHEAVNAREQTAISASNALKLDSASFKAMVSTKGPELAKRELDIIAREVVLDGRDSKLTAAEADYNKRIAALRAIAA